MKVIKITLVGGMELFVPFDELQTFKAQMANIEKLKGIEMSEKDYNTTPTSNQGAMFFERS